MRIPVKKQIALALERARIRDLEIRLESSIVADLPDVEFSFSSIDDYLRHSNQQFAYDRIREARASQSEPCESLLEFERRYQ